MTRYDLGEDKAGVYSVAVDFTSQMVGSIPSLWLYGGLAVVAALYATFFGLGAVANPRL